MATVARISIDEYLRSHYEPECELIEGELQQKPMGTVERMSVERALILALHKYEHVGRALPELSIRISENTVLIPDFAFVRHPVPSSGILEKPPLLCVEVLSPSDRFSATLAKMERYRAFGVEHCWIIDPMKKTAWTVSSDGRPHEEREMLRAGELEVALSALFE